MKEELKKAAKNFEGIAESVGKIEINGEKMKGDIQSLQDVGNKADEK